MASPVPSLLKILLMIFLRPIKLPSRHNLRHNRLLENVVLLQHRLRRPRFLLLLRIMIKNRRPVLRPHIRPLPVHRSRVVTLPENRQQFQIRNLLRIKLYVHRLRMPSAPRANLFVVRVLRRPARITHSSRCHSRHLPKRSLHSPKTPRRKSPLSHDLKSPSTRNYELRFRAAYPRFVTPRQIVRDSSVTASPRASVDFVPQAPTRTTPPAPPPESDASARRRAAPYKAPLRSLQSAPWPTSPPRPPPLP